MISENELKELVKRKQAVIETFDSRKQERFSALKQELVYNIRNYNRQNQQLDGDGAPPADVSVALNNLDKLETKINLGVRDLNNLLGETAITSFTRDVTDAGTLGGNGFVAFRSTGKFTIVPGTLTQKEIEDKNTGATQKLQQKQA